MRPPGAQKKRGFDADSSQYEDVDLAEVDIADLGKMLNPQENIQSKMKRAGASDLEGVAGKETSMVDLVKPQHKMTVAEVIERLKSTVNV